jgi:hypothetical protein
LLTILLVILFGCSVLYMYCMRLAFAHYSTCYFILLLCTVHVCGWHLLTILLVILFSCAYCTCMWLAFAYYSTCYFILLQCTVHVCGWCVLGLISMMLITPDVFVGGFPAVPPKA